MSIKVLVADDSITIQKVIGIIFGGDDYSLTVVDNGKAAIDKARELVPDILLIDALMPGMSGYEVAEAVRATPSLAHKPILILTGSFEPFDEEKAKKCGADDYISKPFESQQIITKVKELLELGSSRSATAQVSQTVPTPEVSINQSSFDSAPVLDIPEPVFAQQTSDLQPAEPADIWGAFTPEADAPEEAAATSTVATPVSAIAEPDVFAIVTEESDAQVIRTDAPESTQPNHTGSQWVPVEENTFEFDEEVTEETPQVPQTSFAEYSVPEPEPSFGDIAFEDETEIPAAAAFTEVADPAFAVPEPIPEPEPESIPEPDFAEASFADFAAPQPATEVLAAPFAPLSAPVPTISTAVSTALPDTSLPPVAMSEEQLKAALAMASKEVIERIVWEIVPDLAEVMIREAIRKIKEGV